MKKIIFILFIAVLSYGSMFGHVQRTVTFKPGPSVGEDAVITTSYGVPNLGGFIGPLESRNLGDYPRLYIDTWTVSGKNTTSRGLIKFAELSTIPQHATIITAELKIYGAHNGSGHSGDNNSVVRRVTSAWEEQNVNWNTMPSTTDDNEISIAKPASQFDWNLIDNSANLVAIVQDMISNPESNFGFMIKLVTEEKFRLLDFISSDNSDSTRWPELTITYELDCPIDSVIVPVYEPCEANFSYMLNTANPNSYYFTAANSASSHNWTLNGNTISNAASFTYSLTPGQSHTLCYYRTLENTECEKCITICTGVINDIVIGRTSKPLPNNENIPEPDAIISQTPVRDVIAPKNETVKIYPNPTKNGWTVNIVAEKEDAIKVQLSDMEGKIMYSENKILARGNNSFVINANGLATGVYALRITGKNIQVSEKLIKK